VTELPFSTRALLYLYSTRNIVACVAALLGPLLLFLGVIRDGWLLITAALYAAGYFATPAPRVVDARLAQSLSFDALIERLDRIIGEAKPELQPGMIKRLESIRESVTEVLPKLADVHGFDDNLYTIRETVLRYLPETLASYVSLPRAFRASHALKDGKSARDLLTEQLAVLDEQMTEVVANVARGDAEALVANGQFLESRFREREFLNLDRRSTPAAARPGR
jgi:hypothetical protein